MKGKKPEAFKRFEQLTKRLLSVPKNEIDDREKERKPRQRRSVEPDTK